VKLEIISAELALEQKKLPRGFGLAFSLFDLYIVHRLNYKKSCHVALPGVFPV
jgi:hypothetical protein